MTIGGMKMMALVAIAALVGVADAVKVRGYSNQEQNSVRELKGSKRSSRSDANLNSTLSSTVSSKSDKGGKKSDKGTGKGKNSEEFEDEKCRGTVVVANQGDASISILDATDGELLETITLPYNTNSQNKPVPVDIVAVNGVIYVGDKANDRVIAIDAINYNVIRSIGAGSGVGEMAVDSRGTQLWVNNVIDNTTTVIDLAYLVPIRTVEASSEAGDGVVNDVILSPSGDAAFVTYTGDGGSIVKYDTRDGSQLQVTRNIGNLAKVSSSYRFNCLYVPSESTDTVRVLFSGDLFEEIAFNVTDPYDAEVSRDGKYVYISSTAQNSISIVDIANNKLLPIVVKTETMGPQKMATTSNRLFVQHKDSDYVSIYSVTTSDPMPVYLGKQLVGLDPFGMTYCEPTRVC
jgi:DNA-binding beta-propeller fold protein YncE